MVVNPYIEKGLIARTAGNIPFDHTSIVKTVQKCFNLTGSLTERDKVAPDLSGLLTRDGPRKDDIPVVKPLKWEVKAGVASLNDLHRAISKVLEEMTGNAAPESGNLMEFIQTSYKELVWKASPKMLEKS